MTQPVVFISYSHRDEVEKNQLLTHLGVLQHAGLISTWSDEQIGVGNDWEAEIDTAISRARIAVLLITANYLNSEFILRTELPELLRRRQDEGLVILPIIAKACAWRAINWLQQLSVRPQGSTPVWANGGTLVDENLACIAEEILGIVAHQTEKSQPKKTAPLALPQKKPVLKQPQAKHWRVLSIEDEPSWQKRLARLLREINCKVVIADSYDQAMDIITSFNFDLITIDLNLDKSTQYADGLELMPRIREMFGNHVPIIIITGTGGLEEQRRAFKDFNVFDFIPKAKLDVEEFQNIVIEAVHNSYTMA